MSHEWHPEAGIGFVAFFVVVWCGVSVLIGIVGGWRRLAETYRAQGDFDGPRWRFTSARMRFSVNYNGCLILGANAGGLYMATLLLFRLGHPALFVPWSDVGVVERSGLVFKYLEFSFVKAPGVTLRVRRRLGLALLEAGRQEIGKLGAAIA